jgi:hypothetical protein
MVARSGALLDGLVAHVEHSAHEGTTSGVLPDGRIGTAWLFAA